MKSIKLTQNQITWVDEWNFDYYNQWNWQAQFDDSLQDYYAIRTDGKRPNQVRIFLHREIAKTQKGWICDHINHNTLFNLESNLRNVTSSQNSQNRNISKRNTSGYKGVSWHKGAKKFLSCIGHGGKSTHLGYYIDPLDAAKAYDVAAWEFFGEFAKYNFPNQRR